jgi:hypothetical protein
MSDVLQMRTSGNPPYEFLFGASMPSAEETGGFTAHAIGWRLRFVGADKDSVCATIEPVQDPGQVVWGYCRPKVPEAPINDSVRRWKAVTIDVYKDEEGGLVRKEALVYVVTGGIEQRPPSDMLCEMIGAAKSLKLNGSRYAERLEALRAAEEHFDEKRGEDAPNEGDTETKHATKKAPIPSIRVDVAVVGAGVAGLYSAYHLLYRCNVALFEASERFGGRICSTRYLHPQGFRDGRPYDHERDKARLEFCAEFGPMRIELDQQSLLRILLSDLSITSHNGDFHDFPQYRSPTSHLDPDYHLEGAEAEQHSPLNLLRLAFLRILGRLRADAEPRNHQRSELETKTGVERLNEILGEFTRAMASHQSDWQAILKRWVAHLSESDYQNIRDYAVLLDGTGKGTPLWRMGFWNLLSEVLPHRAVTKMRDLGTFYHLIGENPNAVEWLVFWLRGLKTSERMIGINGGMQRIADSLADRIPEGRRKCCHTLIGIRQRKDEDEVELTFSAPQEPGGLSICYAKHVILALPQGPLEQLMINNWKSFGEKQRAAVDSVQGFEMTKLFVIINRRWWRRDHAEYANRFATQVPTRELHYFASGIRSSKKGMIMFYADSPAAKFLANYIKNPGAQDSPEWATPPENERLATTALEYVKEIARDFIKQNPDSSQNPKWEFSESDVDSIHVEACGIRDWERKPYRGANHKWLPNRRSAEMLRRLASFPLVRDAESNRDAASNNVHICGEAYSDYHGFIEGALRSAAHALHTVSLDKHWPNLKDDFKRTPTWWLCTSCEDISDAKRGYDAKHEADAERIIREQHRFHAGDQPFGLDPATSARRDQTVRS